MDLLAREMLRDDPGQQALLDRLLDVALVQILREHLPAAPATPPRAGSARSADARIDAALSALHADPAHQWTVAAARRARADVALGVRAPLHRDRRRRARWPT